MALCIRLLSDLPTSLLMFFRCGVPVLLYLPMLRRSMLQQANEHRGALLSRGLQGTLSLLFYVLAIRHIPLADAVLTSNTSPLWAALAAWLALKERLNPRLLWAFPLSFAGVMLVAGTRGTGEPLGYVAGLLAAAFSGWAFAIIRKLPHLPPELIAMAFSAVATLCSMPFAVAHYQAPTFEQWKLIAMMGVCGAVGQWFMTLGYRYNTAATAASMQLASVAITAVLGYFVLGETLGQWQLVGILMIFLGTAAAA